MPSLFLHCINRLIQCAADNAWIGLFGVADKTRFVDVFAGKANVGGGSGVLIGNTGCIATETLYLPALLRSIILIGYLKRHGFESMMLPMDRFDKIMDRWWSGAALLAIGGLSYVLAFVIVMIPIYALDALNLYNPSNWTYWGAAAILSPYIAGSHHFLHAFKAAANERINVGRNNTRNPTD